MTPVVQIERHDGVLTLRMMRTDKLNALTRDMYTEMARALESADKDSEVRAVLVTGGPDCFTSGNDIQDFLDAPPSGPDSPVFDFMRALFEARKPVVAAVAGPAVGIGVTLLLHCDAVCIARDAKLRVPFVQLGLCPEFGASLLLPRLLGPARAARLLLLCEPLSGELAVEWGLGSHLAEDGVSALRLGAELASRYASLPTAAVIESKRLMRMPDRELLRKVILEEAELFAQRLRSPEAVEAFSAFMQRRMPDFNKLD